HQCHRPGPYSWEPVFQRLQCDPAVCCPPRGLRDSAHIGTGTASGTLIILFLSVPPAVAFVRSATSGATGGVISVTAAIVTGALEIHEHRSRGGPGPVESCRRVRVLPAVLNRSELADDFTSAASPQCTPHAVRASDVGVIARRCDGQIAGIDVLA